MPELPEVEVVKRSLTNKIKNLVIKRVKVNDVRLRYVIDKKKIKKIGLRTGTSKKSKKNKARCCANAGR